MDNTIFNKFEKEFYLSTTENKNETNSITEITPKVIFIVPYRDREQQLLFFQRQMEYILEDYQENHCKVIVAHQNDKRSFNCGAMKNIGFLIVKQLYPNRYYAI